MKLENIIIRGVLTLAPVAKGTALELVPLFKQGLFTYIVLTLLCSGAKIMTLSGWLDLTECGTPQRKWKKYLKRTQVILWHVWVAKQLFWTYVHQVTTSKRQPSCVILSLDLVRLRTHTTWPSLSLAVWAEHQVDLSSPPHGQQQHPGLAHNLDNCPCPTPPPIHISVKPRTKNNQRLLRFGLVWFLFCILINFICWLFTSFCIPTSHTDPPQFRLDSPLPFMKADTLPRLSLFL